MSREDEATREVPTGEQPKLSDDEKNLLLKYVNDVRREKDEVQSYLRRKMAEGAFFTVEGSRTLSHESQRYERLIGELDRLHRLLWLMGRKGQI